jgi:hypothetical protein
MKQANIQTDSRMNTQGNRFTSVLTEKMLSRNGKLLDPRRQYFSFFSLLQSRFRSAFICELEPKDHLRMKTMVKDSFGSTRLMLSLEKRCKKLLLWWNYYVLELLFEFLEFWCSWIYMNIHINVHPVLA